MQALWEILRDISSSRSTMVATKLAGQKPKQSQIFSDLYINKFKNIKAFRLFSKLLLGF
jgi:hypothetical protein